MTEEWVTLDAQWVSGTDFIARTPDGGVAVMGEVDGIKGIAPMKLMLASLAGCTGVDVALILSKKRADLRALTVQVRGKRRAEHPRVYVRIHLHYVLWGNLNPKDVEHAIRLSEEKYCSASAMLRATAEITHDYEIRPAEEAPSRS